ncbi:MAG: type II toxin-antitoxin system HicB family antitoxin [bacterium]
MPPVQLEYTVIYEPAEEGGYIARIPFLNDLTTQGETLAEAKKMAKDAIECYISGLMKDGIPIPQEKKRNKFVVEKIQFSVNTP